MFRYMSSSATDFTVRGKMFRGQTQFLDGLYFETHGINILFK